MPASPRPAPRPGQPRPGNNPFAPSQGMGQSRAPRTGGDGGAPRPGNNPFSSSQGMPRPHARNIIPLDYTNAVRDYARGNLDEAELWAELTALGYDAFEIEWHIANPGQRRE